MCCLVVITLLVYLRSRFTDPRGFAVRSATLWSVAILTSAATRYFQAPIPAALAHECDQGSVASSSAIMSISTQTPNGSCATLTALREWMPRSPNT